MTLTTNQQRELRSVLTEAMPVLHDVFRDAAPAEITALKTEVIDPLRASRKVTLTATFTIPASVAPTDARALERVRNSVLIDQQIEARFGQINRSAAGATFGGMTLTVEVLPPVEITPGSGPVAYDQIPTNEPQLTGCESNDPTRCNCSSSGEWRTWAALQPAPVREAALRFIRQYGYTSTYARRYGLAPLSAP